MQSPTFDQAEKWVETYGSPLMVISKRKLAEKLHLFRQYLPNVKIFYAIKSNPAEGIIEYLAKSELSFDVASKGEIEQLIKLGIAGERMIYANPVKTVEGLTLAQQHQVRGMTFDSEIEINKMAELYPGAQVLLRIQVNNPDALVDLNSKFGVHSEKAADLWRKARDQGLDVVGLCFHVGSQSLTTQGYRNGMEVCRELFDQAQKDGMNFRILDIGGGFPIMKNGFVPDVPGFLEEVASLLEKFFPETEIWAEPGRYICGEAGTIITSVIGVTERHGKPFYTLDEGIYGSFNAKFFDHWDFDPRVKSEGEKVVSCLAGPSCDSIDVLVDDYPLPSLKYGDVLIFDHAGAYTFAAATNFNGFEKLSVVLVD